MSSGGSLSRALTDLDYYEFGGFERCKAHKYVDNPRIDVGLGSSLAVALDEKRGRWSGALKCALAEQGRHERADVDRKSTRLNSSHLGISYAVFCLKKKNTNPDKSNIGISYELFRLIKTQQMTH